MTTAVDREALSIYLNDHLAGSVAAIDLLDHMIADDPDPALARELIDLQSGLMAERPVGVELVDAVIDRAHRRTLDREITALAATL